jgi:tRNA threonylcarbamoyladenosine biosynthesis protein TsaB
MILALETSGTVGSVALCDGDAVLGSACFDTRQEAVRRLPQAIYELLATYDRAALEALAVSRGPGSFNGLRVGIALAKALAHALRLPVIGVPTPAAWAAESAARCPGQPVAVLQPSRRDYVYLTVFAPEIDLLAPCGPSVVEIECLAEILAVTCAGVEAGATVVTGDWPDLSTWAAAHPGVTIDAQRAPSPSAVTVARLAAGSRGQRAEDSYYTLRPEYVSPSQAERNWGVSLGL